MNSATISVNDLTDLLGISRQAVMKRANKENWSYRKGDYRAKKFIIAKLPIDIQSAIVEKTDVPKSLLPSLAPEAALSAAKRMHAAPMVRGPKTVPLADWQKTKALAWADVVRLYLLYIGEHGGWGKTGKAKEDFLLGFNAGAYPGLLKEIGQTSVKTLDRKVLDLKKSKNDAFIAFAPKYGGKKGATQHHPRTGPGHAVHRMQPLQSQENYRNYFARPGPSCTNGASATVCATPLIAGGFKTGAAPMCDQWALWTGGEKALNDQYAYWIKRDYSKIEVGDVLIADGHVLNFDTINPWTGKPKRMIMVLWRRT